MKTADKDIIFLNLHSIFVYVDVINIFIYTYFVRYKHIYQYIIYTYADTQI